MEDFIKRRKIILDYYENKQFYNQIDVQLIKNPEYLIKFSNNDLEEHFLKFLSRKEILMYFEFLNDMITYRIKEAKQKEKKGKENTARIHQKQPTTTVRLVAQENNSHPDNVDTSLSNRLESNFLSHNAIIGVAHSTPIEQQQQQQNVPTVQPSSIQPLPSVPEEFATDFILAAPNSPAELPSSISHQSIRQGVHHSVAQSGDSLQIPSLLQQQNETQRQQQQKSNLFEQQLNITDDPLFDEFRNLFSFQEISSLSEQSSPPQPPPRRHVKENSSPILTDFLTFDRYDIRSLSADLESYTETQNIIRLLIIKKYCVTKEELFPRDLPRKIAIKRYQIILDLASIINLSINTDEYNKIIDIKLNGNNDDENLVDDDENMSE